ncbi:MAG: U32 family peptidase [Candidatus Omnitrophica bacterium]|nr:U32 family peptidase [Candidatus Omnitrophota bacterium]
MRKAHTHNKPELVSPAGSWASLTTAVDSGADAVYFGIKGLNMRKSAENFDLLQMEKVMDLVHSSGRKGYLALNVLIYDRETQKIEKILKEAKRCGVDAVILWDMSVLTIARELGLRTHLSTQASVSNFEALKLYSSLGISRAVLARECTLEDIRGISERAQREVIECGIECFIHGAMCVSVSGRCFMSLGSFAKSANRGECLQPCRREYLITEKGPDGDCSYMLGEDYVLSPRDLCTMGFFEKMMTSGAEAFKIEGRMRSADYVGAVTSAYREAIDAYYEGNLTDVLKSRLWSRLGRAFNRGFSEGFYFGRPEDTGGVSSRDYEKIYIGEVRKFYKKIGVAEVRFTCGPLERGQTILVTGKTTPASFARVEEMEIEHTRVDNVAKGESAGVRLPFEARPRDKVFLWVPKEKGGND